MKNLLKGKSKNTFISIIIMTISIVIGIQWYMSGKSVDTYSYVVSIKGITTINGLALGLNDREKLVIGDELMTAKDSICVIEWGDGSLTRLGEDGKILIQELDIQEDLSQINLQFKLIDGKTWSNVVSFLGEKSYFKQNFEDIEAAVRGTIFDVDLKTDTLFVQNHEVELEKGDRTTLITEGKAFNFKTFSFVDIQEFINNIRDKTWVEFNKKGDTQYFQKLKTHLLENVSTGIITNQITKQIGVGTGNLEDLEKNLTEFSGGEKQEIYLELLEQYQKFNFVSADDGELFTTKNQLKKLLIATAGEEDKKSLIQYSIYDLKDAIDVNNIGAISGIVSLISDNQSILENINTQVLSDLTVLPEGMQGVIGDQLQSIKGLFKNIPTFETNFNVEKLKSKATGVFDDAKGLAEGLLNNLNK